MNAIERQIISAALAAVDPRDTVAAKLEELRLSGPFAVLSIGKAAAGMYRGAQDVVGAEIVESLLVCKHAPARTDLQVVVGDHPIPGAQSAAAARRVMRFVDSLDAGLQLLVLLSGGGSALLAAPIDGVTVDDLGQLTRELLHSGATIDEINVVRRATDLLKGGGLAARHDAPVQTLVMSDVLGDPLEAIASGPTVANPTTCEDAIVILERYGLERAGLIEAMRAAPTFAPSDVEHHIVASCATAVAGASKCAVSLGLHVEVWSTTLTGEARDVGVELGTRVARYDGPTPACLLAGGETTVNVVGDGIGGRNLEVALGAVSSIAGMSRRSLLTFATDGEDGPTSAAGARVDGETLKRAAAAGLDPQTALANNDSFRFFDALDALVCTGPTGTNVNDLVVALVYPPLEER